MSDVVRVQTTISLTLFADGTWDAARLDHGAGWGEGATSHVTCQPSAAAALRAIAADPSDVAREEFRAVAHFHPFEHYDYPAQRTVVLRDHTHQCLPVATRELAERDALGFQSLEASGRIRPVSHTVIERRLISDWMPVRPQPADQEAPEGWRVENSDWPSGDGPHLVPDDQEEAS